MKIYMLNPPYFPRFGRGARWQDTGRGGTLYYPIWLSYATAVVEQGHKTRLVDAPAWNWKREDVIEDIKNFKPDLIVIDSSFPSLNNDIKVSELIKQSLDSKTVLVGPPTSQFPEEILQSSGIDIVARWEYDFTIKDIVDGKNFEDIKGISYKDNGKIIHNPNREFTDSSDLDNIPFVSKIYEKYLNIRDYFLGQSLYPEVQIFTGRGCPNRCTFCSWPQTLIGKKYRVRSVSNVLDELEYIQDNLTEVNEVFFEDDTFTIDNNRINEFVHGYMERGLSITWACNARANLRYEEMKAMKSSNCRLLISGFESGNDIILKNIKKGITTNQIRDFSRNANKVGLLVHGDFIIGLPGETLETIDTTRKLINEIKPDILQVAVASPFPGTEFYDWCKGSGYMTIDNTNEYLDDSGHQKSIISYPELTNIEMEKEVDKILKEYYLSLNYVPIAIRQILRKNSLCEIKRILHSVQTFLHYIRRHKNENMSDST